MLEERKREFPIVDAKKQMADASFLFRRLIVKCMDDKTMSKAMSMFWQYLILSIDTMLQCKEREYNYL